MDGVENRAAEYFKHGYNCAQSVILSLAPSLNIDKTVAESMALGFGGGMGAQNTCGAVSAAYMIMGLYVGKLTNLSEQARKNEISRLMTAYNKIFNEQYGSINCRSLTGEDFSTLDKVKDGAKWDDIHQNCTQYVIGSVIILEDLLKKK
jgi:C_GCAxxG_C_C family probable redox protein